MKLVALGPPGAGKGTQAINLAKRFGLTHASTGDIFRAAIKSGTELGKQVKDALDSGKLVSDELTCRVVEENVLAKTDRYILDGFPRTVQQAERLEKALQERGQKLDAVVFFALDDAEAVQRLTGRRDCEKCGRIYHVVTMPPRKEGVCDACGGRLYIRSDAAPEKVQKRLAEYHEKTEPLVPFYENRGLLRRLDAALPPDRVLENCVRLLETLT